MNHIGSLEIVANTTSPRWVEAFRKATRIEDPLLRIFCGIGVALLVGSAVLPHPAQWTTLGVAVLAFCYLVQD